MLFSLVSVLSRDRYGNRYDNRSGRFDQRYNREAESDHRRRGRSRSPPADKEPAVADEPPVKKKKEEIDPILTRTGGAYIPPAKLRMMQQQISDKSRYNCFSLLHIPAGHFPINQFVHKFPFPLLFYEITV